MAWRKVSWPAAKARAAARMPWAAALNCWCAAKAAAGLTAGAAHHPGSFAWSAWQGRDYASIVLGGSRKPVQDYLLFTYDDYQAGQAQGPYVAPPQHVLAMREKRWKIGLYFDENGKVKEMKAYFGPGNMIAG